MGEPGLEFVWVGDDAVDPLQQAQTLQILVNSGIKTRDARYLFRKRTDESSLLVNAVQQKRR